MAHRRTAEDLAYHADKQKQYRREKREERDANIARLGAAASVLMNRHDYTPGQLLDLIIATHDRKETT